MNAETKLSILFYSSRTSFFYICSKILKYFKLINMQNKLLYIVIHIFVAIYIMFNLYYCKKLHTESN